MQTAQLLPICIALLAVSSSLEADGQLERDRDPALWPPTVLLDPGPRYGDAARLWQGIPGIERAPNGRLWALWYSGGTGEGPDNYVVLVTSGDDGHTWSPPQLIVDPAGRVRAYDPALWHAPDGRLWLFWAQSYGWWDGRSGVWAITTAESGAERPTWSAPRRLCDGIMMNKPTVLTSGDWVLPAAVWNRPAGGKGSLEAYSHDLGDLNGGNLVISHDQGRTWSILGQTQVPERVFDEHMLIERRDGSLWTLVRTSYGIGESISTNGGRTWSAGQRSNIRNANARFHIRRLQNGQLLVVHHDPPGDPDRTPGRSHLTAHISDDDGRTWSGGLVIDERAGVSYPDACETPGGLIYLIYDFSRQGEKEILMATFTAEDVAAGKPVSEETRFRVRVNKAGPRPNKE